MTILKLAAFGILALVLLSSYLVTPAMASNFDPNPPTSLLVGPSNSYYYVTHQPHGPGDTTIDSRTAHLWNTASVSYYTDLASPTANFNGLTTEEGRTAIVNNAADWRNVLASNSNTPTLTHIGQSNSGASLSPISGCGNTVVNSPDGKNVET